MAHKVRMTVNGKAVAAEVAAHRLLVDFLREELRLTGTHVGCDTSQCGACTVHVNGAAVKSCTMLAVQADGAEVLTIEGLAEGDRLHPMQEAFHQHHGLQCGFCTPRHPRRSGDPPRARRQSLSLYGLSEHRRRHRRRCEGDGGRGLTGKVLRATLPPRKRRRP